MTRSLPLGTSFWNDEAYTAVFYVERGPATILGGPYVPNNHVLFSLLAWATTSVLGRSEAAYRLWSVVPAVLAVLLLTEWVRRRLDSSVACCFLVLVTVSPLALELSIQARGYGLGFLAMALLLVVGGTPSWRPRFFVTGLSFAGLLGICTLPVFVLPFLGGASVLAQRPRLLRATALAVGIVGLGALCFYSGLLGQILTASGQEFGNRVSYRDLVIGPYRDLFSAWVEQLVSGFPEGVAVATLWTLMLAGVVSLFRRGEGLLATMLLAPIVSTYLGLALLGLYSVPRFVSYLLLPSALLIAAGFAGIRSVLRRELARSSDRRLKATLTGGGAVLAVATAAWVGTAAVRDAHASAKVPLEGYREALEVVRRHGISDVLTNSTFSVGFDFYARGLRMHYPPAAELQTLLCGSTVRFAYVDYPLRGRKIDLECLRRRRFTPTKIPQRAGGAEGEMSVWIVDEPEWKSGGSSRTLPRVRGKKTE